MPELMGSGTNAHARTLPFLALTEPAAGLREVAGESGKSDGLFGPAAAFFSLPARSRKDPGNPSRGDSLRMGRPAPCEVSRW